MTTLKEPIKYPIVFYDGECGFCSRTVNFLLKADSNGVLHYAPLQGETAAGLLPEKYREDLSSFVLLTESKIHTRSNAAMEVIKHLPKKHRWLRIFRFVPRFIRDGTYMLIAKNRYRLFGKRTSCRLPEPSQRLLFLP